ncbi:MAG: TIGR03905 family TSCPD domain-containing protein [Lachnospiraceae bacterium]|nr:TIGR03905 family TSCPD domain-containing protein [Lachnospiraceae bacterium]MDN4745470.1 TIGR03905 family TSCPD domain-containing protein [Lachnospiraceae bacterium C1.1]
MEINYKNKGTCSRGTHLVIDDDGIIREAEIQGGCAGNTLGLCSLIIGQKATDVADRLRGIRCGMKPTSCPDQLAKAIDSSIN